MTALGIALAVIAIGGSIGLLVLADQGSHSVSDTLYRWIVPAVLLWLASAAALIVLERRHRS